MAAELPLSAKAPEAVADREAAKGAAAAPVKGKVKVKGAEAAAVKEAAPGAAAAEEMAKVPAWR